MSKRLLNKPRKPVQLAADIVERVLVTKGDPYLQTHEHVLSWLQSSLLDVKLFLALVAVMLLGLAAIIIWLCGKLLVVVMRATAQTSQGPKAKAA